MLSFYIVVFLQTHQPFLCLHYLLQVKGRKRIPVQRWPEGGGHTSWWQFDCIFCFCHSTNRWHNPLELSGKMFFFWNVKSLNQLTKLWIPMWKSLTSTSLKCWSTFTFCIFLVRIDIICVLDSVHASVCCLLSELFAFFFKIASMYLFKSLMSYNEKRNVNEFWVQSYIKHQIYLLR